MSKNIFSIFLLVVFVNFIVAPTIISLVDSATDVSSVFSVNEEEKKENKEDDTKNKVFHSEENEGSVLKFSKLQKHLYRILISKYFPKLLLQPPQL
ncbi:hypothetical protein EGM88_09390 [Aureibaculum marinum]|uniref:Uncharacterized protein n=1 Tax=Aureibaculum marinum TaxID=2487930 RepID=A0A3N4NYB4_9FLAO|nr:hypothetical protein [Aureibaculum marinum]RPD96569.1 hypothetical protein EGM88_09390 [Aureibaculum marinum]